MSQQAEQDFVDDLTKLDWVSFRTDELASEIQGKQRRPGVESAEVTFSFATGRAVSRFLEASEQVCAAKDALPDHLALAFGIPAHEAQLIHKAAGYHFKYGIETLIATQVAALTRRDGRTAEFESLWQTSRNAHTGQLRQEALTTLRRKAKPYYALAQEILQDDVRLYNPYTNH